MPHRTSDVEAHLANWNNHEVNVVPSTRALEGFTGTYTSQTATCNSDGDAWGHDMSLSFFMHHSQIKLLRALQAPFDHRS